MNLLEVTPNKLNASLYYYTIDGHRPQQKGYATYKLAMKAGKAKIQRQAMKGKTINSHE